MGRQETTKSNNIALGTFELTLFMGQGVERFPADKKAGLASFLVLFSLLLVWTYPISIVPTERMGPKSYSELLSIYGAMQVMQIAAFFPILLWVSMKLEVADNFWRVVTALNYMTLGTFVFIVPLLFMVVSGSHSWEDIYWPLVAIMYYRIALTALVITKGMKVPWEFAAGLALFTLFIDQTSGDLVLHFAGVQ